MAASERKERLSFAVSDSQGKPLGACPQCGGVLEEGIVAIHGTWWSGLFAGWSYENLWFHPHGGQKTPACNRASHGEGGVALTAASSAWPHGE